LAENDRGKKNRHAAGTQQTPTLAKAIRRSYKDTDFFGDMQAIFNFSLL
jgi:hypothetical protein